MTGSPSPHSMDYRLSPTVKSLCLKFSSVPPSETLNLVCSFPLLEDLTFILFGHETEADKWTTPLTSPKLSGSLTMSSAAWRIGSTVHRLVNLPNGLRFTKIVLVWVWDADPSLARDLVMRCSETLESLDVTAELRGESPSLLCLIST